MEAAPDCQVSLTDPDARSMASQGKGTGIVGYNIKTEQDYSQERTWRPPSRECPNGREKFEALRA